MSEDQPGLEQVRFLTSPAGQDVLREVAGWAEPGSLAAATRLRKRLTPGLAAAVISQVGLRAKAKAKFGPLADSLLFTPAGLEQATRMAVAEYRARVVKAAGFTRVVDLGCGLGADSLAFVRAGLEVCAVEFDPMTAGFARHNLAAVGPGKIGAKSGQPMIEVRVGDAVELAPSLLSETDFVFADPARRTGSGRTWRVEDFSPGWSFVEALLERPSWIKMGPGTPHRLIPDAVSARWISAGGDLVETALTTGLFDPGSRGAVLLPREHELAATGDAAVLTGPIEAGQVLYEPDPAVIRALAVGTLAEALGARQVTPEIPYLVGVQPVATPFARAFSVVEVLPWKEKTLKAWCREHDVGVLDIKKRGVDVDPALLRKRLKLSGNETAAVVISPSSAGTRLLVVDSPISEPFR